MTTHLVLPGVLPTGEHRPPECSVMGPFYRLWELHIPIFLISQLSSDNTKLSPHSFRPSFPFPSWPVKQAKEAPQTLLIKRLSYTLGILSTALGQEYRTHLASPKGTETLG